MKKATFFLLVFALVLTPLVRGHAQQAGPVPQAVQPALAATATPVPALAPARQGAPLAPAPQASQKPTPAPAAPTAPSPYVPSPNVRIDVTITDQTGNAPPIKKMMTLVASRNGSVRSGVNVPIASTTFGALGQGGVNTVPISSYNYRMMGLNLDVRDVYVSPSSIRLGLSLEYNPIDEAAEKSSLSATTPVSFSNFSQSFTLELENGKPLLVAQTSDPVPSRNRTLTVEVKATIVK